MDRGSNLAAGFLGLLLVSPPALASHYRLSAIDLVTDPEREALEKSEVDTTVALFDRAAKTSSRQDLAKRSGLSFARLTELATQCDLLRIKGVGPSIVRLLQAGGIRHAADLRRQSPGPLHARLAATNATHGILEVIPDELTLADWIEQARGLPKVLEGVR